MKLHADVAQSRTISCLILILAACLSAGPAYGQGQTSTWLGLDGTNWEDNLNWSTPQYPNGPSTSALINFPNSMVFLSSAANVLNLTVGDAALNIANTLTLNAGAQLTVNGSAINNFGTIVVNSGGSLIAAGSTASLQGGSTLAGCCTVTLNGGNLIASGQLTNVDNLIQGWGGIGTGNSNGTSLINQGTINASVSGQTLGLGIGSTGSVINGGTLEATGGTLAIGTSIINNTAITANGGSVQLMSGSSIKGGTLIQSAGTLGTGFSESATLDSVTIHGTYTGFALSTTTLLNTITNNGNIVVGLSTLNLGNNVTLTGGGNVNLIGSISSTQGGQLTNLDNTIHGAGAINSTLVNGGTITADSDLSALSLSRSVTNSNVLQAITVGILQISSSVANAGGTITAAGGTVQLMTGSSVMGGTLLTNGGTLGTAQNNTTTLDSLTIAGVYTAALGSTTNLSRTVTNNGSIQVLAGSGSNTSLGLSNAVTLNGGGTVTLTSDPSGKGIAFIQPVSTGGSLTNVDNTIQGSGTIQTGPGQTLNNQAQGTIGATGEAALLTLAGPGSVTNQGTLQATQGGTLQIANSVNNSGGTIRADSGGAIQFQNGASVTGGTLNATTGGTFYTAINSSVHLDAVTINGPYASADSSSTSIGDATVNGVQTPSTLNGTYEGSFGSTLYMSGTFSNALGGLPGTSQLNGGQGYGATSLFVLKDSVTGQGLTLSGGGTLQLNSVPGTPAGGAFALGAAVIDGLGTLTNVDNTIQGSGVIQSDLFNEAGGVINANVDGQLLVLPDLGQSIVNLGTLEATGGGILQIGTSVNNAPNLFETPGQIVADGGTVQVGGITGGTLVTKHGGWLGAPANASAGLDSVTIDGSYTGDFGSTTHLSNTITITDESSMMINAGGGKNTGVVLDNDVTIEGPGTLFLNTMAGGGSASISQVAGGLTLTNVNGIIEGSGIIGSINGTAGLALTNQTQGVINANVAGQALLLNGAQLVTNAGILEATSRGILEISNPLDNNGGTVTADDGTVQLNGGKSVTNTGVLEAINGGILDISNPVTNTGGNITADGGTVELLGGSSITNGTLNTLHGGTLGTAANNSTFLNSVTISGTYTADFGSFTVISGTITNTGTILMNGGPDTDLNLSNSVVLNGGGTLTLTSGLGGRSFVGAASPGLTLTNVNNTIQGGGVIGTDSFGIGGLVLMNQATINANSPGQALMLSGGGMITNTGVLEATNGGILQISNPVANAGGNITADGGTVQLMTGSSVTGGTLNAFNGGTLTTAANNSTSLGTVTINGTYTAAAGSTTLLSDTITNNGNIQIDGANLVANGAVTLAGGGALTLAAGSSIAPGLAGGTLTNVDNTIQGAGVIGAAGFVLQNQAGGTVNANVSSATLTLADGEFRNAGVLEATNGGTLDIQTAVDNTGGTITANSGGIASIEAAIANKGGIITANGGSVVFHEGSSVNGGIVSDLLGGTIGTAVGESTKLDSVIVNGLYGGGALSTTTITSSTVNGSYIGAAGSELLMDGTFNNLGQSQLNGTNGAKTFLLVNSGNLTLSGGGTLTLNGAAYISQAVTGATLTNVDNTIQGAGAIGPGAGAVGVNGLTIVNQSGGTLLANVPGGTLAINSSGNLTNSGTLQVNAGSTLAVSAPLTNFSGNTLTGGTYTINGAPGQTAILQLASPGNSPGGEIVNNAAAIILNGPTANTLFVDAGGNNLLTPLAANSTASSIFTIMGGYNFATLGGFSNSGEVNVDEGSVFMIGTFGASDYTQAAGSTNIAGTLETNNLILLGGLLNISAGGAVNDASAGIAGQPGSRSNVIVSGGIWTTSGSLDVGVGGPGSVTVTDNGQISAASTTIGAFGSLLLDPVMENLGALTLDPGGVLTFDIAGAGPGEYSQIDLSGFGEFDGTLDFNFIDGFDPLAGAEFNVINAPDGADFSSAKFAVTGLLPGFGYTETFANGSFSLVASNNGTNAATPEPAPAILFAAGLAALACLLRGSDAAGNPSFESSTSKTAIRYSSLRNS